MSKFTLQYEEHYSFSPDLEKYFVPFNNDRFQECLDNRRKYTALMSISSRFNQDKTTLIATNNPLPDLTHSPQVDTPMKFFTKEQVGKSVSSKSQIHFPVLKRQPNQLTAPRNSLAVGKVGKPLQFRFSTDTDFKSEGQFSRNYAEKKMKRLYPHLHFHTLPGLGHRRRKARDNGAAGDSSSTMVPPSHGAQHRSKEGATPHQKERPDHKRNRLPMGALNAFLPYRNTTRCHGTKRRQLQV